MVKKIEALVKPELLKWARNSIGLSIEEVSKRTKIKLTTIEDWESGHSKPSIPQLRKLSKIYKRPLAIFFLPEPPKTFDAMKDFRRISEIEKLSHSPSLLLEIRRANYKREIALELIKEVGDKNKKLSVSATIDSNPEELGKILRELLGVSLETQYNLRNIHEAFNTWKIAVENLGILVFQTGRSSDIDVGEMRGFSISNDQLPVIIINSRDSVNGKIFTMLHELTHIIINNSGICDLENYTQPVNQSQKVETFCNRVAGAVLVPEEAILSDGLVKDNLNQGEWSEDEIKILSKKFGVSGEVILRRLLILGRTTEVFYQKKREELLANINNKVKNEKEGFPPYFRLILRDNGVSYTKLLLNAYYQEIITASQLSDYLGMNLKHLTKVEKALTNYSYLNA